jgi:hypothetical protein
VKEKQVDVITEVDMITGEKKTVDVRKAVRNLHNEEMYMGAFRILVHVDNAYLSSGTVNLLMTALNDNSVEARLRATILLGLSRNPQAIAVLSNRLSNDSSWRIRYSAAKGLGSLAEEAAVPALKAALAKERMDSGGLICGLGFAGGTAVPLLIEMLEEEINENGGNGGAMRFIQSLAATGDRRAIKPLLAILSHPASPTDPNMSDVQLQVAIVLAQFAVARRYAEILKSRAQFAAVHPVGPRESRKVKASDRARIIEGLKNAGYDINRLPWFKLVP